MDNNPKTVEQFHQYNHIIREQQIYLDLINNRSDKIDNHEYKMTVLMGYYKIHNFMNKFFVKHEANKRIGVQ